MKSYKIIKNGKKYIVDANNQVEALQKLHKGLKVLDDKSMGTYGGYKIFNNEQDHYFYVLTPNKNKVQFNSWQEAYNAIKSNSVKDANVAGSKSFQQIREIGDKLISKYGKVITVENLIDGQYDLDPIDMDNLWDYLNKKGAKIKDSKSVKDSYFEEYAPDDEIDDICHRYNLTCKKIGPYDKNYQGAKYRFYGQHSNLERMLHSEYPYDTNNIKDSKPIKDAALINDYSNDLYISQLEKLIPEFERLGHTRELILKEFKKTGREETYPGWDNDPKINQWVKQVNEVKRKWNELVDIIFRGKPVSSVYKQKIESTNRDSWFTRMSDYSDVRDIKSWVKDNRLNDSKVKDADDRYYPMLKKIAEDYTLAKKAEADTLNVSNVNTDLSLIRKKQELAKQARNRLYKEWNDLLNTTNYRSSLGNLIGMEPSLKGAEQYRQLASGKKDSAIKDSIADSATPVKLSELGGDRIGKGDIVTYKNKKYLVFQTLGSHAVLKGIDDKNDTFIIKVIDSKTESMKDSIVNATVADALINDAYMEVATTTPDDDIYYAKKHMLIGKVVGHSGQDTLIRFEGTRENLKNFKNAGFFMYDPDAIIKDSKPIKDRWSGVRSNGVIFALVNGQFVITHKNGAVEKIPKSKFSTSTELFNYLDSIKDSAIKDSKFQVTYQKADKTGPYLSIMLTANSREDAENKFNEKYAKGGVYKALGARPLTADEVEENTNKGMNSLD